MKKFTFAVVVLLGITLSGCGASEDSSSSKIASIAKDKVCTLLTTAEVTKLVGKKVLSGELETKHTYPNASVCTWKSAINKMPLLVLTYYLNASSHTLDYYAPPLGAEYKIKKINGTKNESIAVVTSNKNNLFEVITRSGKNAILITAPFIEAKEGSKLWRYKVELANIAADRAKGE